MRLDGRIAFVTGGASGIGAATARRLTDEGARVAVADRDREGAEKIAADVGGFAVRVDVTDGASVRAGVAAAEEALGPIGVLVNNAGGGGFERFLDTDERAWDFVLGVNLRGAIACTHAVLGGMHERGAGVIVNVASEAGRIGVMSGATYAAAKAGVIGFTKAIARESAMYGVRCNAVAPGPIETPLLNAAAEDAGRAGAAIKQGMIDATVMGRAGEPEEVAAAIAYLASDDAAFVTGHTLPVSGGLSMW